jgi:hypothetical protein
MHARNSFLLIAAAFGSLALSACNSGSGASADAAGNGGSSTTGTTTGTPTGSLPGAPVLTTTRAWTTDAMVFSGSGTWSSEVASIEALLTANGLTYKDTSSAELDAMTTADLGNFGLLIFPGGEGSTEAEGVSTQTHANLRYAVQTLGVSYLGFCAGSFVAVAPAPAAGADVTYGFGVVNGPVPNEWIPTDNPNASYEMQLETFADGTSVDLLWYGGPITPNTGVIAKYPTGDPAISEMWSGAGFVVLSGVHPTADQAILSALGMSGSPDTGLAVKLMKAALNQEPLPTF